MNTSVLEDWEPLVTNWEPLGGVLATNLPKMGWFRHYYFFYRWEPLGGVLAKKGVTKTTVVCNKKIKF